MPLLSEDQQKRALEILQEYLSAPVNEDGRTPWEVHKETDRNREKIIGEEMGPLLESYLTGDTSLDAFKSQVDGINKRHEYWGFKGIKGQMFFNMAYNSAEDLAECDQELKAAITVPANEEIARSRIRNFQSYVRRLGENVLELGGSKHARPKTGSIPFFLSYFWQIQDPEIWPVYYTNSVNMMGDLNLWQPTDNLAKDYITYKNLHEELAELFTANSDRKFGLYEVEHVFWFRGGNPYGGHKPISIDEQEQTATVIAPDRIEITGKISHLPESFIPPIVAIIPRLARHDPALDEASRASGTSIDRAFEKSIHSAFTILGYETELLGQGQGRVPDGWAIDIDSGYAILWDAKVRADHYSMGTDDRTIREYIVTQSRDLKKHRHLRNIYYAIISSRFAEDYDDPIRMLKMETDINEVCLIEADALITVVDMKLRSPQYLSLGSDGIQCLFSSSGVLTSVLVQNLIG